MKKISLLSLVIIITFVTLLNPLSANTTYANSTHGKGNFLKQIQKHEVFNSFRNELVSTEPYILNDLLDIDGRKIGYLAQYEVELKSDTQEVVSTSQGDFNIDNTITSLLTFLYNEKENVMEVILIDYTFIETEKNIYVRNFTSNHVETISLSDTNNQELISMVEDIENNNSSIINEIQKGDFSKKFFNENNETNAYSCSYWTCTKYKSGGGDYSGKCMAYAGAACTAIGLVVPVGSLICAGVNLIGCYVPKYKICVDGYWKTGPCPIQSNTPVL